MPFYERGPVRIHYEEKGSGFPLLVIPGGGLNSTIAGLDATHPFNALKEFSDKFRCIVADLRNANPGQSSGPLEADRPWDSFTDDHIGLMDHLGIKQLHGAGLLHRPAVHLEPDQARGRPRGRRRADPAVGPSRGDADPVLRQQHEGLGPGVREEAGPRSRWSR